MEYLKTFMKGKGLYGVLSLCIVAAAAFSFVGVKNMVQQLNNTAQQEETQQWDLPGQPVEQKAEDVPVTTPQPTTAPKATAKPKPTSSPASSAGQSGSGASGDAGTASDGQKQPVGAAASSCIWPVDGPIQQAFSGEELVYNETLKDWRTHNGVDIAAKEGTVVKATTAGTVKAVYQDALWGQVVEVEDANGIWRYCGLQADSVPHKEGDSLSQGQAIGKVGKIDAEQTESHLHLERLEGETYRNPEELLPKA